MASFLDKYRKKLKEEEDEEERLKQERETIRQKRSEGEFERGLEAEPERPEPKKQEVSTENFLDKYKSKDRKEIRTSSVDTDTSSRETASVIASRDARDAVKREALRKRTELEPAPDKKLSFGGLDREFAKSAFLGTDVKKVSTPTKSFKELDKEFKKVASGKDILGDRFKDSRFFGTDVKTSGRISDNPLLAGITSQLPIIGAGIKRDAPEELDLAQEKAKVIIAWGERKGMKMAQSSFLGTDVGEPYKFDIPEGKATTYDLGRMIGTGITFAIGGKVAGAVGKGATVGASKLISKTFPKLTDATVGIISSINASGVSLASFNAVTGLSKDQDPKEYAKNVLAGYGMGLLFGSVANSKRILDEVIKANRNKLTYFRKVKSVEELIAERNTLAKKWHPDFNPSNIKEATNKMIRINKDFDTVMSKMVKKIKPLEAIRNVNSNTVMQRLAEPSSNAITTIDKVFTDTLQNKGAILSLNGLLPSDKLPTIVKGTDKIIAQSEFSRNAIAEYVTDNYDTLKQTGNFIQTTVNKSNVEMGIATTEPSVIEKVKEPKEITQIQEVPTETIKITNKSLVEINEAMSNIKPETLTVVQRGTLKEIGAKVRDIQKRISEGIEVPTDEINNLKEQLDIKFNLQLFAQELKKYKNLKAELIKKGITKVNKEVVQELINKKETIPELKKAQADLKKAFSAKLKETHSEGRRITEKKVSTETTKRKAQVAKVKEKSAEKLQKLDVKRIEQVQKVKTESREKIKDIKVAGIEKRKEKATKVKLSKLQTKTLDTLKKLRSTKVSPEFEKAKQELIDVFDLKAKNIRPSSVLKLENLQTSIKEIESQGGRILDEVKDVVARLDKKQIGDLTEVELDQLLDSVKHIIHESKTAKKMLAENIKESTDEIVKQARIDMKVTQDAEFKQLGKVKQTAQYFWGVNRFQPRTNIEMMTGSNPNSLLAKVWDNLRDAETQEIRNEIAISKFFKDKNIDKNDFIAKIKTEKPTVYETSNGKISLTQGEKISLKLLEKQDQSYKSLLDGGGRVKGQSNNLVFTQEDLKKITLTKEEQRIADTISEFLGDTTYTMINDGYVKVHGFELPQNKNYFPIARDFLGKEKKITATFGGPTLESAGFLKERVSSSKGIVIPNVWDIVSRRGSEASRYGAFASPIRDFKKVIGAGDMRKAMLQRFGGPKGSEKSIMESQMEDLIKDIEGQRYISTFQEKIINKNISKMQRAVLGLNIRTVPKQVMSYFLAATELEVKYLIKGAMMKVDFNDPDLPPEIWLRIQGKFSRETGEIIESLHGKLNIVMSPIKWADTQTVGKLWNATKLQIAAKGLKKGTDEFRKVAHPKYKKVLDTQPNYTTLERSGLIRDPRPITKFITIFSSAKEAAYNTVARSIIIGRNTGNWKPFRTAISGYLISAIGLVGVDASVNKLLDRDTNLIKRLGETILGTATLGDKLVNLMNGYGIENPNEAMFNDLADSFNSLYKVKGKFEKLNDDLTNGKISQEVYDEKAKTLVTSSAEKIAKATSKFLGIPLKNAQDILNITLENFNPSLAYQYKRTFEFPTRTEMYSSLGKSLKADSKVTSLIVADMKKDGVSIEQLRDKANRLYNDDDPKNDMTEKQLKPIFRELAKDKDDIKKLDKPITQQGKIESLSKSGLNSDKVKSSVAEIKAKKLLKNSERRTYLKTKGFTSKQIQLIMRVYY